MQIIEELIYTGENFNIVFDKAEILNVAYAIIKEIVAAGEDPENADELKIDMGNNKIFIEEGTVGNYDTICRRHLQAFGC